MEIGIPRYVDREISLHKADPAVRAPWTLRGGLIPNTDWRTDCSHLTAERWIWKALLQQPWMGNRALLCVAWLSQARFSLPVTIAVLVIFLGWVSPHCHGLPWWRCWLWAPDDPQKGGICALVMLPPEQDEFCERGLAGWLFSLDFATLVTRSGDWCVWVGWLAFLMRLLWCQSHGPALPAHRREWGHQRK